MMQKVNTVFVGKQTYVVEALAGDGLPITANRLTVGDIVAINPATGGIVPAAALIATATFDEIQLGLVKSIGTLNKDANITKTQVINRKKIKSITANNSTVYVPKVVASSVIEFSAVVPVVGHRYVIRVIYKDLYEHPGQFTHSYEVIATSANPAVLSAAFAARIVAHKGARVTATDDGTSTLTLTAKSVTDNGYGTQGKEAITPYSQVSMVVVAYKTDPSSIFGSAKDAIGGIVVSTIQSSPGKGNPHIVRDREQAALGYKGITYRTEWPVIKPELNVDLSKNYDTLVIEFARDYQSPDNQYIKSTDLAAEVYIDTVGGAGDAEVLRDAIALWAGLQ